MKETPTPRTKAAIELASDPNGAKEVCDLCEELESELAEARKQRDDLLAENNQIYEQLKSERKASFREQRDMLQKLLSRILGDLPQKRDWLDPVLEREALAAVKGKSHD